MRRRTEKGIGSPNQIKARVKFEAAYEKFMKLALDELGFTEWTRRNYGTIFKRLIEFAREKGMIYLGQLTKDDIRSFGEKWENLASRRQMITRIRAIFNILESEGLIEQNPTKAIRIRGDIKKRLLGDDEWLTFDEANRLILACKTIEERATVLFALRTGVRRESLVTDQRQAIQIDLENKKARVFEKREKERIVYFDGETFEVLKKLFSSNKRFPCFSSDQLGARLAQLARTAGIQKKVTPITLRHTFACHCRLKGIKIEDLRDLMGHENIQTTLIYANVGATEQQRAYEKIWGKA